MRSKTLLALLTASLISACNSGANDKPNANTTATPNAIDSAIPREVELERFRAGLGTEPVELSGGLPSRDALVAEYVRSLQARDTAAVEKLGLTKAEFAWIYYPTNPMSKPPYDLSPGLMYFQFDGNSRKGLFHALEERGGQNLKVVGHTCAMKEQQGENTIYSQCVLRRFQAPGDTLDELLFGGIIERRGKFKIINFANKF